MTLESLRIRTDSVFRDDGKWNNRNKIPFCFVCSKHLSSILTLAIMGIFTADELGNEKEHKFIILPLTIKA